MARLLSLNVGLARDITWQGKRVYTAIRQAAGAQPSQERPVRQPAQTVPKEPAGIAS